MRLPVEMTRAKARGVATLIAHKGADVPTELQRLRSWILTRGVQPAGRGSWTITGSDDFQVRHDIDREDVETETVPQERVWLQAIPSLYEARVEVPRELSYDLPRIAGVLRDWTLRNGYEVADDPEVFLPDDDRGPLTLALAVRRTDREDWIEV
jgi:hypothetical protein